MAIRNELILNALRELTAVSFGEDIGKIEQLKADSSNRLIFRIHTSTHTVVGVYNENISENSAFISFTESFFKAGLPVPQIISASNDKRSYLMSDLGNRTLFSISTGILRQELMSLYEDSLRQLVKFQTVGKDCIDFSSCHAYSEFNTDVIRADIGKLNDYFIGKHADVSFSDDRTEELIEAFSEMSTRSGKGNFMYRDFQPRNIMVTDEGLKFIDYQSGMRGPSLYDLASFVYSGSIELSEAERDFLVERYKQFALEADPEHNEEEFRDDLPGFALLRTLQVLGSYSFVSHSKNDLQILRKIPPALERLKRLSEIQKNKVLRDFAIDVAEAGRKNYS